MDDEYFEDVYEDSFQDDLGDVSHEISKEEVEYYFTVLKSIEEHEKNIQKSYDKQLQNLDSWLEYKKQVDDNKKQQYQESILSYYRMQKEKNKDFKLETPYGKVSERKQQPKWEYNDDVILQSLKKSLEHKYIKTRETVDKSKLKKETKVVNGKVVTDDGVIIDGIKVLEQGHSIKVKLEEN